MANASTAHLFLVTQGTVGTMSVPITTSIASIFICVAKVAEVELVHDVQLLEVMLLAHAAAPQVGTR